jgi:hypothetical protein
MEVQRAAVKLTGFLMSLEDHLSTQVFDLVPHLHQWVLDIVLIYRSDLQSSLNGREVTAEEEQDMRKIAALVKEAVWCLSNMAAGPPYMLDALLRDHTLEEMRKLAQLCANHYPDIEAESLYFLTNLVSNATKSQFHQRLLSREMLSLLVKSVERALTNKRLLTNLLDAIDRYITYDIR